MNKTAFSCKINFNIAGAFAKFTELSTYFVLNRKILDKVNFTVYDGINLCHWNGGRINEEIYYSQEQIDFYYKRNINIALTFSNNIIDINDKVGNELLEKFHKEGNKIILVNDELRKYIRKNFPKYILVHSITDTGKLSPIYKECINYYKDLETKYNIIVPKMEHAMYLDHRVNLEQYEIMVNDSCTYNCPLYNDHFKKINEQNLLSNPPKQLTQKQIYNIGECWLTNFNPDVGDIRYKIKEGTMCGMDLSTEQLIELKNKGIRHFKISGREMCSDMFRSQLDRIIE